MVAEKCLHILSLGKSELQKFIDDMRVMKK